jgi:ABC-type cobalamin transport system permease subunit
MYTDEKHTNSQMLLVIDLLNMVVSYSISTWAFRLHTSVHSSHWMYNSTKTEHNFDYRKKRLSIVNPITRCGPVVVSLSKIAEKTVLDIDLSSWFAQVCV